MSQKAYTTSEVAKILGVSPSTLRRYVSSGSLPEPGWTKQGLRKQRAYSEAWVDNALKWLERT